MSTTASVPVENKSAKKRKGKGEAAAGGAVTPSLEASAPAETHPTTNGVESHGESSFIKDLTKNIRNINKKISSSAKADAVVSENPGVALDDLVAQRKLNADQKAQILKKPALQAQLQQLEEQLSNFRAFAQELEEKAAKEKAHLIEAHEAEIAKVREEVTQVAEDTKEKAVEDALRTIIQFLHTAASKRQIEDAESDEAHAFEGALLLVYQGNDAALSTLKNLVYGTDDKVIDVHGEPLDFTFAQVKKSSAQSSAPEVEDKIAVPDEDIPAPEAVTDSTVANAGLTELDDAVAVQAELNGAEAVPDADIASAAPEQTSIDAGAANAIAEEWDPQASAITDTSATNDEWVQVPRDPAETDTGVTATPAAAVQATNSWAEEVGAAATNVEDKPAAENDGFSEVRRERGRGRGGRGGRGEFRGRGRGGRDGHRGGGRGGRDGQGGGKGARGGGAVRGENKS
ncbi:hypothetical protein A1O7_05228 [Cladophialophora yegresii CBS 114405]|uniref:YAG7-like dimerisation domain-containing protein n=1 Tax=Cladophialophora yegresii CBS 114405 TaxID=1182544 RepID=W9W7V5_9EURO|nr:uncharacterized protein A1O7_05228 [Cladophialophora yegresii CBS 114405]EXJ61075.1 hypothetical protein A1O7_05228 [Cladophialophora yegresii CBS 114405]